MGDLQAWPPLPNGGSLQVYCRPLQPQAPPLPTNSEPSAISDENWQQAKKATEDVLTFIQPSAVSEQRRKSVVEYVQRVLKRYTRTEVFPFGSVPLKTYLPDGDIDLTAFGYSNSEDSLANDVRSVLEVEEQNKDAEFEVNDVQYINAEVKLVKCLVENIVVDISFNQIGGLCTLCFLEKVDEKIGKEHLFKRSIILIKAWCYYESRILGAHHGLISTYALETMVLCVFHLFHRSLDDPFVVLYRFLDFYSKFDWESYCVSLQGPVSTSSLPELVVHPAYSNGIDLLFSKEFFKECTDMFSVPPRYSESSRVFSKKHLNIVDPLKPNNNLGRSVSKGNFYRIRSAFTYGAQKLGRVLLLTENIAAEVCTFFSSTLGSHGSGERPDVQDASPRFSDSRIIQGTVVGSTTYKELNLDPEINGSNGTLFEEINNIKILDLDDDCDTQLQFNRIHSNQHLDGLHAKMKNHLTEDASDLSLDRDATDLARLEAFDLRNVDENHMAPCHDQIGVCPSGEASHAPHLFFHLENGCQDASLDNVNSRGTIKRDVSLNRSKIPSEETICATELCHTTTLWFETNSPSVSTGSIHGSSRTSWNSNPSEYSNLAYCSNEGNGNTSNDAKCIKLSDLLGDFSTHYANLCFALSLNQYTFPIHGLSPSQYQNKYPWNAFHQQGIYTHIGANGLVPAPPFPPAACYPPGQSLLPGVYGAKDMQKPRGTGTYFPDMNSRTYRERVSPGRGKNQMSPNQLSRSRNNGRVDVQQDRCLPEEGSNCVLSQTCSPVLSGNDCWKPASSDVLQSSRSGTSFGNGSVHHLEGKLEFGSLGPVPLRVSSSEKSSQLESVTPCSQDPAATSLAPTVPSSSMSLKCERAIHQYQLKDESDFPPL